MAQSNKSTAHSKLNDDATGTGQNLDQVLHFGLIEQIQNICKDRAQQFAEHGLTQHDVLEEIKRILSQDSVELDHDDDEEDEEAYNRAWQMEIAREAGAMYGQQAYHDHMGYDVEFDPDEGDCFACGGHGCGRCDY